MYGRHSPCIGQFCELDGVAAHPFSVLANVNAMHASCMEEQREDGIDFEVVASTVKGKACCFY